MRKSEKKSIFLEFRVGGEILSFGVFGVEISGFGGFLVWGVSFCGGAGVGQFGICGYMEYASENGFRKWKLEFSKGKSGVGAPKTHFFSYMGFSIGIFPY